MKSLNFVHRWTAICSLFILFSFSLTGCKDNNTTSFPVDEDTTVLDLIETNSNLETFSNLIKGTSIATTLSGSGPVTVFAPSDEVFAQLPEGYLQGLTAEEMWDILRYHIYGNEYPIINEIKREAISSIQGDKLFMEIGQSSGTLINGTVKFTTTNIEADNGIIHIIDGLLLPDKFGTLADNIEKRYDNRSFFAQMAQSGLTDMLNEPGNKTLLASHDLALNRLESEMGVTLTQDEWREIMLYHILDQDITGAGTGTKTALVTMSGDSVYLTIDEPGKFTFNNSWREEPLELIEGTNGKIFFVDGVMLPDKYIDVLTLMGKRFNLKTTRAAFADAKLTGTLYNSNASFTVFVPRDEVPELNNWPDTEAELAEILKYHVLNVKLTADQLQDGQSYTTWHGETITIQRNGDTVTINGTATISLADLEARNGVVHVINGTLTPPAN